MNKTTEAHLRAQKKYDAAHKDYYKTYNLKFNRKKDAEVIFRLDTVPNKIDYIRELILKDIENDYIQEVMDQKKKLGIECPPIDHITTEGDK